jgi:anthranilate synthase component I
MQLSPSFAEFEAGWAAGRNQIVWARLAADLDTPVSLMLKLGDARADTFMLESVTGGEVRGRYSIVGMKPDLVWQCRGTQSRINREARFDRQSFTDLPGPPLQTLRDLLAECRIEMPGDLPAVSAGLFGYLGYDMIRLVEHLPDVNPDPLDLPDAELIRPSVVAVLDGVKGDVTVVAPAWVSGGLSARAAYAQAAERVMDALRDLDRAPSAARDFGEASPVGPAQSNFTHDGYKAAVEKAKDYIRAGDIFQVVPSQRWAQRFTLPPFALYRSLRRTNPSPFMFFFNFGGFQVIGASPEILVRLRDGEVTVRPIAGTRKRGATPDEDKALELDLLADPKERAPDRDLHHRTLQPRHAYRIERGGRDRGWRGRSVGPPCRASGRHRLGRAQGSRDGDHRRAGTRKARRLWRGGRLLRGQWRDGLLHRAADGGPEGRDTVYPGRGRRRLRQRPRGRVSGNCQQIQRLAPRG